MLCYVIYIYIYIYIYDIYPSVSKYEVHSAQFVKQRANNIYICGKKN